jgi:hypothetical protein
MSSRKANRGGPDRSKPDGTNDGTHEQRSKWQAVNRTEIVLTYNLHLHRGARDVTIQPINCQLSNASV